MLTQLPTYKDTTTTTRTEKQSTLYTHTHTHTHNAGFSTAVQLDRIALASYGMSCGRCGDPQLCASTVEDRLGAWERITARRMTFDADCQNRGPSALWNHGRDAPLPSEADIVIVGAGATGKPW